jgi:hypothetical protein
MVGGARNARWTAVILGAAVVLATAAACSQNGSDQTPAADRGPKLTWTTVASDPGVEPVTLTAAGPDRLLVGWRGPEGQTRPRLSFLDRAGTRKEVPLKPVSPKAFDAKWLAVVTDGTTIEAVGGAPGGAHSNTRWTTWRGTASGVVEYPQRFEAFGGWGAGSVVGLVTTSTVPIIVGSWESRLSGQDAAVWLPEGNRWIRQSSAGTALESTPKALVGARSAAQDGGGVVLSGSLTLLGSGSVTVRPAAWRSPGATGPWRRIDLPAGSQSGEAHAAACQGGTCLMVGQVGGRLAAWELRGDSAGAVAGIPAWPVSEGEHVIPPVATAKGWVWPVVYAGRTRILTRSGSAWVASDGPPGAPLAAAALGDRLYVVTATGDSTSALAWTTLPRPDGS